MEKIILFIVIIFTIGFITNNKAQATDRPYYLLIGNIEDQKGNGEGTGFPDQNTTVTNLIDMDYWDPLQSRAEWKPWTLRAPFSPSTFAQYPITSFDFVVIPMQDKGLDYSIGGIKVIDKINELIAAGKDIILVGSNWLGKAANDPDCNKFVTETLGLIPEKVSLIEGNTYVGYHTYGVDGPITAGHDMHFNGGYERNGTGVQWPVRLYREADMFTVKQGSDFKWLDKTVAFGSSTKYVGGMTTIGQSTIAVWSVDWSNCSGATLGDIHYTYKALVELFLSDTPKPEPYLESEFNKIQMGSCELGDSLFSTCRIVNNGRKPLVVTDIKLWRTDQTCFTIMKNPKAFTLEPGTQKKLMVRFKPPEDGDFTDDLMIISNAVNCSNNEYFIGLEATGGQKMNYGPCLSITGYPVDFGKIMTGKVAFADVEVTNTGQSNLVIDSIFCPDKNQKDFIYADEYKMPKVVIPGNTHTQRFKFIPLKENQKYTTKVKICTNGYNTIKEEWGKGIGFVTLIGETFSDKAGSDIVVAKDEMLFGTQSKRFDTTIVIRNAGDEDLLVQAPVFSDCDQENEEAFSFSPAEIPVIIAGADFTLTVTFDPPDNKEYICNLNLSNNSANPTKRSMKIWFNGEGKGVIVKGVNDNNQQNLFDVKVIPNPVTDNSEIQLSILDDVQNNLEITLVDMLGKEVMKIENGVYSKGEYKYDLNRSNIASGKYLLIVKFGFDQQSIPVIVK